MLTETKHGRKSLCRCEGIEKLNLARVTSVLSDCLCSVVQSAKIEGQLVIGVRSVVAALEKCGDEDPVLCILATEDKEMSDPAMRIYFTLIEAYCREYGVHLLKVDNSTLLGRWARTNSSEACGCVLIQHATALKGLMTLLKYCRQDGQLAARKTLSLVDPMITIGEELEDGLYN
eukprot:m.310213 g.310213  ORF g.310213 m.310213 type:complete len:175 (+) comp50202_c0_seq1:107-631(+)